MRIELRVTWPVTAREITEARIGPTQGVHSRPSDNPINIPPKKPLRFWLLPARGVSLANNISDQA